jgi:ABC-type transport system involved in multi-copper enzyme maturation permease subunit
MSLFGLFIAIFIGIGLVSREIERRSIYAMLAKPVRRHEFIIGKYLGLVGTLLVESRRDGRRVLRGAQYMRS